MRIKKLLIAFALLLIPASTHAAYVISQGGTGATTFSAGVVYSNGGTSPLYTIPVATSTLLNPLWTQIGSTNDVFNTLLGNVVIGDLSGGTFTTGGSANLIVGQLMGGTISVNNQGNGIFANADNSGSVINDGLGSLVVGNGTDSGVLQVSNTSNFALGYVSGSGSIIHSLNGDGNIANGATFNGGAIFSSGDGAVASGYASDPNSQIASNNDGSYATGGTFNGGQINSTGIGTIAAGYSTDSGSTINSLSDGSIATGGASNGGVLNASANASAVFGYADGSGSSVQAGNVGALAHGYASNSGVINANGAGSLAGGISTGASSQILANTQGGFAHGFAENGGQINVNGSSAGTALGKASGSNSVVSIGDDGALASGGASNGGVINAQGIGGFAHGSANNGGTINTSSGQGSEAFGWVNGGGSGQGYITANGFGAFAGGSVDATYGTNSQVDSNSTAFSWGFVNSGAVGILANSNGAMAMGASIDTGSTLQSNNFGAEAIGVVFNGSNMSADGQGSHAGGRATGGSLLRAEGNGSFTHGWTDGSGSDLSAEGSGDFIHGVALSSGELKTFSFGASAGGYVDGSGGTAQIEVGLHNSARGGVAHGESLGSGSGIYTDADGGYAGGYANSSGVIENFGTANFLYGYANGNDGGSNVSTLSSNASGGLLVADAEGGGIVRIGDNGSWAGGEAYSTDGAGTPSEIHASRTSFAYGSAQLGGTIEAISGFTGSNLAFGMALAGETVTAEGTMAVAIGQNVTANGTNLYAFGKDFTNATSSSFAVGYGGVNLSVDTSGVKTYDSTFALSTDQGVRYLYYPDGVTPSFDYGSGLLFDTSYFTAINIPTRLLENTVGDTVGDWSGTVFEATAGLKITNSSVSGQVWTATDSSGNGAWSTGISGLVPYSGATGNVDLGAHDITSTNAHFTGKLTVDGPIDPTYVEFAEIATPSTPSSGRNRVYFDSTTHLPKYIDPAGGTHTFLTSAAAVTSVFGRTGAVVAATNDYSEAQISFSNITTNDVSTSKHGYTPIAPNNGDGFLADSGAWSTHSTSIYVNDFTAGHDATVSNQLKVGSYASRYQNITTNGIGFPTNYCENNKLGTTTAGDLCRVNTNAFVAGYGTFWVSCYLNVNSILTDVLQAQISYTDENNAAQTVVIPLTPTNFTGTILASASATGNNSCITQTIRVKQNTDIVGKIVFTTGIGSVNYDTGFSIHEVSGGFNPN